MTLPLTSARRRVLIVEPGIDGHHLGYAKFVAAQLAGAGWEVYGTGSETAAQALREAGYDSVPLEPPSWSPVGCPGRLRFAGQVARTARALRVSVVHYLQLDRLIGAVYLTQDPQMTLRGTLHWAYMYGPVRDRLRAFRNSLHRAALMRFLRSGGRVMVHSPGFALMMSDDLGTWRVDYVPYPWGIDLSKADLERTGGKDVQLRQQRWGVPEGSFVLLAFGGVRWDKGPDLVVQALAQVDPEVHLVVAGKPYDFTGESLRALAKSWGVEARVHLDLTHVPEDVVATYFRACDAVVLPYRRVFMGQSGPLVAAGAIGVPVIASDVPVLAESVTTYRLGRLFRAEDVEDLGRAIREELRERSKPDRDRFVADHGEMAFRKALLASYGAR